MSDEKKPEKKEEKKLPWGLPVFLLLLFILAGYGIAMGLPAIGQGIQGFFMAIGAAMPNISQVFQFLLRIVIVFLIVYLVVTGVKSSDKKEEHH